MSSCFDAAAAPVAGCSLERVELLLGRSALVLDFRGDSARSTRVAFQGIRGTTLLSPWDGNAGRVEWLREVHCESSLHFFELRVWYGEVPRNYRIVCGGYSVTRSENDGP